MKRNLRNIVASLLFLTAVQAHAVDVFFSPGHGCEDHIVSAITSAKHEIRVDVYSINNLRIVRALELAHRRGIKIRILTDHVQAAEKAYRVLELVDAGLDLRVNSKYKIEHNKYAVFDDSLAVTGSYNWTEPASNLNSENCVIIPDANVIASYQRRFEELWSMNSVAKSKKTLAKIRARRAKHALSEAK